MTFVPVISEGRVLLICPEVATELRLTAGQTVDDATRWRAIDLNVAVLRAHEDARPGGDPRLRAAITRAIEATERVVARHYASTERTP